MEVVSLSPLPVGGVVWQPRQGAWVLSFACKATFRLLPGRASLADEHEPLYREDRHWSDDPGWSLYASSDLVPVRRRADVVLLGEAFAPGGKPARSVVTRLRVGEVDKRVEVWGERSLGPDGTLVEGARFTRMPLLWERAAGGPETANPVGIRADAKDAYGRRALPNLVPPGLALMSLDEVIEPAGYGPIAPTWPERQQKLGRYAGSFSEREWSRQPLPTGLDVAFFNAAPWDQQADRLRDDERMVLEHLHPEHPHLATQLPGHHPKAFVTRPGRGGQAAPMQIELLCIRTDRAVCTVTWRGQVALERPDEEGRVVIALEEPGQSLAWEEITGGSAGSAGSAAVSMGAELIEVDDEEAAPITQSPRSATLPPQNPTPFRRRMDTAIPLEREETILPFSTAPSKDSALPFAQSASHAAPPRADAPAPRLAGTPFTPAPSSVAIPAPAPSSPGRPPAMTPPPAAPRSAPPGPPPPPPPPVPPSPPMQAAMPAPVSAAMPPPVQPPPVQPPPVPPSPPSSQAVYGPPPGSAPQQAPPPPPLVRPQQQPRTIGESVVGAPAPMPTVGQGSTTSAGALGASNAAAAASTPWSLPREGPASGIAPISAGASMTAAGGREVLQLLWSDKESAPRFRRQEAWRKILDELEKRPLDKEFEDPALGKEPMEIEDRREVFEILVRGSATDAEGMEEALSAGIRSDGKLVPPLRILAGELAFPFDEVDALKATIAAVTPFVGQDENLRAAITNAQEFLKADLRSAPAVAEGLTGKIAEAWGMAKRPTPQGYLEQTVERALLEGRCYQRRKLLGGKQLRALAQIPGSQPLLPAYLPDELADTLPLYQRFRVRAIVEVHPQLDQYEVQPLCLKVLALARVAPVARKDR